MGTILRIAVLFACLKLTIAKEDIEYFWHLTDLHYDPWYNTTSGISCNEPKVDGGTYGDYECDSPWELVVNSINGMKTLGQYPSFILWSGDNPPHVREKAHEDLVNTAMIIEITQNITNVVKDVFPDVMVLPMVGNHDYYPKNQLPGDGSELYDALAGMWSDWLNTTDMQNTFKKGAYYSCIISKNPLIRAIVLNTNLYYSSNEATAGQTDPGDQIAWFEDLLTDARQNGEKVLLISHVPFGKIPEPVDGKGWLVPSRNSYFEQAIIEHNDIILSTIAVHSHTDVYKLFYDNDGKAVSSMFVSPSVTPWRVPLGDDDKTPPHNPALRKFYFNTATYELMDYRQYSLDLPLANGHNQDWRETYTFGPYYGAANISTSELASLLEKFRDFGSTEFNMYYDAVYVHTTNYDYLPCGCECKSSHLCAIEYVDYDKFDMCYSELPACGACTIRGLSLISMISFILVKLCFI